jgi:hypothetical protein
MKPEGRSGKGINALGGGGLCRQVVQQIAPIDEGHGSHSALPALLHVLSHAHVAGLKAEDDRSHGVPLPVAAAVSTGAVCPAGHFISKDHVVISQHNPRSTIA